jgi:hypothetical protein
MKKTLVLVAPELTFAANKLQFACSHKQYHTIVRDMQRLRGATYVHDGAIALSKLDADGCYQLPSDTYSWHVLVFDGDTLCGCIRYCSHPNTIGIADLWMNKTVVRFGFEAVIEKELARARKDNLRYAEIGGWAVGEEYRFTDAALHLLLATFALGKMLGGCLSLSEATVRNRSTTLLRKFGGKPLGEPYLDNTYKCHMQLFAFDSAKPLVRYASLIEETKCGLEMVPVVCHGTPDPNRL